MTAKDWDGQVADALAHLEKPGRKLSPAESFCWVQGGKGLAEWPRVRARFPKQRFPLGIGGLPRGFGPTSRFARLSRRLPPRPGSPTVLALVGGNTGGVPRAATGSKCVGRSAARPA
jgi:hypothetical protein